MPSQADLPRAAVAQLCSTADLAANLAVCERLAKEAAERGASLLLLPECFAFLGAHEADKFQVAEIISEDNPGPILSFMQQLAQRHNFWVIGGGIPELAEGTTKTNATHAYNTCVVVSPRGNIAATYRKIHLFDIDIPDRATFKESASTYPGENLAAIDTDIGRVGLSICYDLRFPELYRSLTLMHNATVLVVPAAFTAHTGQAHWHTLLRARAIENQCWVLAAGQSGRHNEKRVSYGHSLIIDPWGTIRDELPAGEGLAMAPIDLGFLKETRAQLPCLSHQVLGPKASS